MDDDDINRAGEALVRWFRSQDILPADALSVMIAAMANAIWSIAGDDKELSEACRRGLITSITQTPLL